MSEPRRSTTGLLLLDTAQGTVAYNLEAVRILAFPAQPDRIKNVQAFMYSSIRRQLACKRWSETSAFVGEFKSGRRTYTCQVSTISSGSVRSTSDGAKLALLLERQPSTAAFLTKKMSKRFGLTEREKQIVELLMQDMSNKELAEFMSISPNTVKAFLRAIMMKLNVSSRAGIIGKILDSKSS